MRKKAFKWTWEWWIPVGIAGSALLWVLLVTPLDVLGGVLLAILKWSLWFGIIGVASWISNRDFAANPVPKNKPPPPDPPPNPPPKVKTDNRPKLTLWDRIMLVQPLWILFFVVLSGVITLAVWVPTYATFRPPYSPVSVTQFSGMRFLWEQSIWPQQCASMLRMPAERITVAIAYGQIMLHELLWLVVAFVLSIIWILLRARWVTGFVTRFGMLPE